jgi:hypothetical protein
MARPVYVFESFDVIRAGRGELIEMLRSRWAPHLEEEYGVRLVGVWATAGSTANWPEANALWEMDDWDHFARAQQARYPLEEKDAYGCELARHSLPLRSGGERALLVGAPFSPDRSRVVAEGLAGPVVLRENATALPGGLDAYLEALESEYLPLARARGLALLGCYENALRPNRAVSLWSFRSWAHVRDHMESLHGDTELAAWERRRDALLEDTEGWLLAPPPAGALRT